jgi:hypothetical protein
MAKPQGNAPHTGGYSNAPHTGGYSNAPHGKYVQSSTAESDLLDSPYSEVVKALAEAAATIANI